MSSKDHHALDSMAQNALTTSRLLAAHKRIPADERAQIALLHQWLHVLTLSPKKAAEQLDQLNVADLPPYMWAQNLAASHRFDLVRHFTQSKWIDWADVQSENRTGGGNYSYPSRGPKSDPVFFPHSKRDRSWWPGAMSFSYQETIKLLEYLLDAGVLLPSSLTPSEVLGQSQTSVQDLALVYRFKNAEELWKTPSQNPEKSAVALSMSQAFSHASQATPVFNKKVWESIQAQNPNWLLPYKLPAAWCDQLGWSRDPVPVGLVVLTMWSLATYTQHDNSRKVIRKTIPKPQWEHQALKDVATALIKSPDIDQWLINFGHAFSRHASNTNDFVTHILDVLAPAASINARQAMVADWVESRKTPKSGWIDPKWKNRLVLTQCPSLHGCLSEEQSINMIQDLLKTTPVVSPKIKKPRRPGEPEVAEEWDMQTTSVRPNVEHISLWAHTPLDPLSMLMPPHMRSHAFEHLCQLKEVGRVLNSAERNNNNPVEFEKGLLSWVALSASSWITRANAPKRKF